MKNLFIWKRISNLAAYSCGAAAILRFFFREYIDHPWIDLLMLFIAAMICLFLVAEVMKYLISNNKI